MGIVPQPTRAKAGLEGPSPSTAVGTRRGTPYTRVPAQSVAIADATDGLLPWLDIDRFHAPCHCNAWSPVGGKQAHPMPREWFQTRKQL